MLTGLFSFHIISRASFCCTKNLRNLHLFSTKVAFIYKHFKQKVVRRVSRKLQWGFSWGEPGDFFAFFNKNKQFIGHISKN